MTAPLMADKCRAGPRAPSILDWRATGRRHRWTTIAALSRHLDTSICRSYRGCETAKIGRAMPVPATFTPDPLSPVRLAGRALRIGFLLTKHLLRWWVGWL